MTDTTPDYAGLAETLLDFDVISEAFDPDDSVKAWNYIVGRAHEAASALRTLLERNAALERERDEERRIVDRIWCQLGAPSYEDLAGRSIYDLINELKARAEAAEARLAEAMKVIEPFAEVAEWDIGDSESDDDIFRPMDGRNSVAGLIRVGHLRAARSLVKGGGDG